MDDMAGHRIPRYAVPWNLALVTDSPSAEEQRNRHLGSFACVICSCGSFPLPDLQLILTRSSLYHEQLSRVGISRDALDSGLEGFP